MARIIQTAVGKWWIFKMRFTTLKTFAAGLFFLLSAGAIFFWGVGDIHAVSGSNGSVTITSFPRIVGPGSPFDINVEICDSTGSGGFASLDFSVNRNGTASPSIGGYSLNPFECRTETISMTAPPALYNSCPSGFQNFLISASSSSGHGSDVQPILLYSQVGLTVKNNTTNIIDVTVTGLKTPAGVDIVTENGVGVGQTFSVLPGGGEGGPSNIWYINCSQYPFVVITISVSGLGTFTGVSTRVQNGCGFQVNITVDAPPPTPTPIAVPTPSPTPVVVPTPTPIAVPSPTPSPLGGWWVDITAVCDLSVSTTVNWTVSATAPLGSSSLIIVKKDGAEIGRTSSLNISGSQVSGSGTYSAEIYDNSGFGPLMFSDSQSITCGGLPPPSPTPSPISGGPVCGNWITEDPETCDDGNTTSGDGCSSTCQIEAPPPPPPPPQPTDLTLNGVPVTCTDNPYNVTFSWTGSTARILFVSNNNFLSSVGSTNVDGLNSISSANFLPPLVLEPGITYQWRILYGEPFNPITGWVYGPSFRADICGLACETRSSGLVENIGGGYNWTIDWVTPDNVKAYDGAYAYSAAILSGTFARTSTLKLTDFGFNIPAANWVYGIKVDVAGFSIPTAPLSFIVYSFVSPTGNLVVNGSATGNFRGGGLFPDRPPAQYVAMGGPTDDWGANLRGSDVNRADFGVAVYDNLSGKGGVYGYIDHVNVTVCHTAPKLPPTPPVNLQASAICLPGRIPQVNFSWEDTSGNEDGYFLDVNQSAWTGDAAPSPWGVKKLAKNATSFTWSPTSGLDSGIPNIPENGNKTYYWRMKAFNKGYESAYAYPANSAAPPGVSVFVPDCMEDLDFNDVESDLQFYSDSTYTTTKQAFNPGELMYAQVKVKNTGADITGPFNIGFYLDRVSVPICGEGATNTTTISGLARGQISAPWRFTVNAPLSTGYKVAVAFADRDCAISESDEANNIRGRVYSVSAPGWFETTAGDVGAGGSIVSGAPYCPSPPGTCSYSTDYLLAGDSLSSCSTKKWKIDSYANPPYPQTSSGVYDYLASRFLADATHSADSLSELFSTEFNLREGDVTLSGGPALPATGSDFVWFINGNLTVAENFTVPVDKTIVFVVRGNITVNTNVSRADGIYVAGGEFNDTNASGGTTGLQLRIDGAVYASTINLPRRLIANNDTTPSDVVNFQPKYIQAFNDILGVPAISWQEVAP